MCHLWEEKLRLPPITLHSFYNTETLAHMYVIKLWFCNTFRFCLVCRSISHVHNTATVNVEE